MEIRPFPKEFTEALPVLKRIEEAGFEAYFVGGCVRDVLLNHPIHDVDIATSATPNEVANLFSKTFDLGIEHGTIAVLEGGQTYEITTFRTESGYEDFRRPDTVTFVRSLKEDLKRRDFTINAFAVDLKGKLIDLFDGLKDLENREIKAVGLAEERFHEDALRMMRGVRFSSQLNFSLEEKTMAAMTKMHPLLEKIAIERTRVEFEKLLLGENPTLGLQKMLVTKLYVYTPHLKEEEKSLVALATELQHQKMSNETVAWVMLCSHLELKQTSVKGFLKSWKLSNERIRQVEHLLTFLPLRKDHFLTPTESYFLGKEAISDLEEVISLKGGISQVEKLKEQFQNLPIQQKQDIDLTGKDLLAYYQVKAGPWVGETMAEVEKKVVASLWKNHKETLLQEVEAHFKWSKHLS